jgi:hypothetical protein
MPAVAAKAGEVVRAVAEEVVTVVAAAVVAAGGAEGGGGGGGGPAIQGGGGGGGGPAIQRGGGGGGGPAIQRGGGGGDNASFSAVAVELRWFVEDLTSAAARTCACVPASTSGIGRAATDGAIATVIAARAWACTSEEAEAGVTGTIGVTACCATVTRIRTGGIATGVGANNPRKSGGPRQRGPSLGTHGPRQLGENLQSGRQFINHAASGARRLICAAVLACSRRVLAEVTGH